MHICDEIKLCVFCALLKKSFLPFEALEFLTPQNNEGWAISENLRNSGDINPVAESVSTD